MIISYIVRAMRSARGRRENVKAATASFSTGWVSWWFVTWFLGAFLIFNYPISHPPHPSRVFRDFIDQIIFQRLICANDFTIEQTHCLGDVHAGSLSQHFDQLVKKTELHVR